MNLRACLFLGLFSVVTPGSFCLDRNAFTFTNYNLNVQIEPAQQRIGVRGKIVLRNDSTVPQKNAALQISSSLDWRSIQIDDKPVQFVSQPYTSDIDHTGSLSEAIVSLTREIPAKGTIALEIGYEGKIVLDATRLTRIGVPEDRATHSDWDQIGREFTAVRGIGYVAWYPVAAEAANLSEGEIAFDTVGRWKQREVGAEMRISLQVSSAAAGPGMISIQNAESCNLDGWPATTSGSDNECTYSRLDQVVPAFLVGPYSTLSGSSATLAFLDDHKTAAQNWAGAADQVLPLVKEWFGVPQRPVQVVELADVAAAPFEAGRLVVAPLGSDLKLAQTLLVHQLTHAALASDRAWIREGLAHFAQALWREQQNGRSAALDYLGLHRTALADAEKDASSERGSARSLISTGDEELYRSKAMFVWWMLRDMVGDAALRKAVAAYRAPDDRQPSYIQHLIETQSHRDLEWFFDDWIYRDRGLPDFRIVSVYPRQMLNEAYLVTVSVENLGAAGAEVPVTARSGNREASQRLEVRGKATATVRIELPGSPDEVIVNDGSVPESDLNNNSFNVPKPAR